MNHSPILKNRTERRDHARLFRAVHLLIVCAIAVVFSIAVWLLEYASRPALQPAESLQDPVSLMTTADFETLGYTEEDGIYSPAEGTEASALVFSNISESYQSVAIELGSNLAYGVQLRVYVGNTPVFETTGTGGRAAYIFDLEEAASGSLSITTDGDIALSDVLVSGEPSVYTEQEAPGRNLKFLLFLVVVNVLIFLVIDKHARAIRRFFSALAGALRERGLWDLIRTPLLFTAAVTGAGFLICAAVGFSLYWEEWAFLIIAGFVMGCLVRGRKTLRQHLVLVFVFLAVVFGGFFLILSPASTFLTFDDETHYMQILSLSYGGDAYQTEADLALMARTYQPSFESSSENHQYNEWISELYQGGALRVVSSASLLRYNTIGYIPAALGMIFGRILHLPYHLVFFLGRLFNLLFYVAVCAFAIQNLRFGRILAVIIALLPVNLYQGCCYTYDGWVFGWLFYAICRYLGFLQDPERKMSLREIAAFVIPVLLSSAIKPVYLPLLLVLFVVPREKFPGKIQRSLYYTALVVLACCSVAAGFVLLEHLLPMLSDTRGGEDVDAAGQIAYILEDPGSFAHLVLQYTFDTYLTFGNDGSYLTCTGYFPSSAWFRLGLSDYQFPFADLWLVLLVFAALTDRSARENAVVSSGTVVGGRVLLGVGSFLSVFLTVTALYISFTPVGADTVNGVQGRYLAPVLLPLFWLLRLRSVQYHGDREKRDTAILFAAACLFLIGAGCSAFRICRP